MKVNYDSALGKNESIKVEKKFRACGQVARTVYSNSKEDLIKRIITKELLGMDTLQEYRDGRWVTIGKFIIK